MFTKDGTQITNNEEIAEILSAEFASNFSPIDSKSRETVPLLVYTTKTGNDEYLLNITIENVRQALRSIFQILRPVLTKYPVKCYAI